MGCVQTLFGRHANDRHQAKLGSSGNSVLTLGGNFASIIEFSDAGFFHVSRTRKNVGISRRFFTNCYFFQLILSCFPRDFRASKNSEKRECRFSRRIRCLLGQLIADPHFGCLKHPHYRRCGILPHPRQCGKMPLLLLAR